MSISCVCNMACLNLLILGLTNINTLLSASYSPTFSPASSKAGLIFSYSHKWGTHLGLGWGGTMASMTVHSGSTWEPSYFLRKSQLLVSASIFSLICILFKRVRRKRRKEANGPAFYIISQVFKNTTSCCYSPEDWFLWYNVAWISRGSNRMHFHKVSSE